MNDKDVTEYKKKYNIFRHHAWAGLGFLSVVLAFRLIFFKSAQILTPVVVILAIYIIIALIFTYKYRTGLTIKEEVVRDKKVKSPSDEVEKERIRADVEKELLKLEKKKVKAEAKKAKKTKK
jgi:uncharacterized membrane protein (DUF106 family)